MMNRYNFALSLLALAAVPLFFVSSWLGGAALIAMYGLLARLANRDLDRPSAIASELGPAAARAPILHTFRVAAEATKLLSTSREGSEQP